MHFLLPNQQFSTQDNETWPASAHFTGEQNAIDSRGVVKKTIVSVVNFTLASLPCSCIRKINLKRQSKMIVLVTKIHQNSKCCKN
jgi:hypothetical protein